MATARREGFDSVRVTTPDAIPQAAAQLAAYLQAGHHGTMDWMAETAGRRADPRALWPQVRSIVMLGASYAPADDPLASLGQPDRATISVYARSRDYHDVLKGRLKQVGNRLSARSGGKVKVFVDTAPVMEKPLAAAAGLGWQGKHTVLVSRRHGSWLFLGAIFTTAELPVDAPGRDHCGSCRRCLDICPTDAFPAPYQLDSRRCIAYLTIEHEGPIPRALRSGIGNRVFGCDDCLAVCPWNRFAEASRDAKLAALDDAGFRARFATTAVKRTGRDRFVRNVLVAIGNSADPSLAGSALACLDDSAPVVRGAAVWALSRLLPPSGFAALRDARASAETDPDVKAEWQETAP